MTASQYAASQFRFHYVASRCCRFGVVASAAHGIIRAAQAYAWGLRAL